LESFIIAIISGGSTLLLFSNKVLCRKNPLLEILANPTLSGENFVINV
jgi:hypothetical protein